jgi:hypothetical protein
MGGKGKKGNKWNKEQGTEKKTGTEKGTEREQGTEKEQGAESKEGLAKARPYFTGGCLKTCSMSLTDPHGTALVVVVVE